jgi:hypothetical protein
MDDLKLEALMRDRFRADRKFTIKLSDQDNRVRVIHGESNYLGTGYSDRKVCNSFGEYEPCTIASELTEEGAKVIALNALQCLGRADMVDRFLSSSASFFITRDTLKGTHDLF